jgi:hypothetical protein
VLERKQGTSRRPFCGERAPEEIRYTQEMPEICSKYINSVLGSGRRQKASM